MCSFLGTLYQAEGEEFLACIVTADETKVHHYKPESKIQSMEWLHTSSPVKKKFKSVTCDGKLDIVLGYEWTNLRTLSGKGETVESASYTTMLKEKLKPAICSNSGLQSKGVVHDNARPHTVAGTVTTIQKLKFKTLNYPLTVQTSLHPTKLSCVWQA